MIDVRREKIAIAEATRLNIPIVAIVDTNCDPEGIDFVVPGNDDALRSIRLFLGAAADAVREGTQMREKAIEDAARQAAAEAEALAAAAEKKAAEAAEKKKAAKPDAPAAEPDAADAAPDAEAGEGGDAPEETKK